MEKFLINVASGLINVGIAIGVVYLLGWLLNQDVDSIVGWVALGMAAGSNRS
jgi:hypothetical protein